MEDPSEVPGTPVSPCKHRLGDVQAPESRALIDVGVEWPRDSCREEGVGCVSVSFSFPASRGSLDPRLCLRKVRHVRCRTGYRVSSSDPRLFSVSSQSRFRLGHGRDVGKVTTVSAHRSPSAVGVSVKPGEYFILSVVGLGM